VGTAENPGCLSVVPTGLNTFSLSFPGVETPGYFQQVPLGQGISRYPKIEMRPCALEKLAPIILPMKNAAGSRLHWQPGWLPPRWQRKFPIITGNQNRS
jgi:hypothetical protein